MCKIVFTRRNFIEVDGEYVATIQRNSVSGYYCAWIHHDGIVEPMMADTRAGLRKLITPIFA
jgi:hypothetical protein